MSFLERGPFVAPTSRTEEMYRSVTLTREEAVAARQLLAKLLAEHGEPLRTAGGRPGFAAEREAEVQAVARAIYQSRKKRIEHFGPALFSEPAWDMLLVLFLYGDRGDRMSVTKLAEFSQAKLTTAIRWLDYLECQRLVEREQCHQDRRKFFVTLSGRGRTLLYAYFESLIEGGLNTPVA